MKQYVYGLTCGILPAVITILVIFMTITFIGRDKATSLRDWIVTNAFSAVITKKNDNGQTTWFFRDIDLTNSEELLGKVLNVLSLVFVFLFYTASSLFWMTLLLDITTSCKPNDDSIECFKYDVKEKVKFGKASSRLSDDPIDCNSAEFQNGSAGVVCYQIVFNIGAACGVSYGGFKLAVFVVNAATSLMLLHQGSQTIKRTKIILRLLLLAIFVAIIVIAVVQGYKGSDIIEPDSEGLAFLLQICMFFAAGYMFVFYLPWNELLASDDNFRLYEPIV